MAEQLREGDYGTWSHCGRSAPHSPHLHDVTFNEGTYRDIQCLGTPEVAEPGSRLDRSRAYSAGLRLAWRAQNGTDIDAPGDEDRKIAFQNGYHGRYVQEPDHG